MVMVMVMTAGSPHLVSTMLLYCAVFSTDLLMMSSQHPSGNTIIYFCQVAQACGNLTS